MPRTSTAVLTAGLTTLALAAALPLAAMADGPELAETHALASDYTWDESAEVAIQLADGATSGGDGVDIDGDTVTVTEPGTYRLSGTLSDGRVLVESDADGVVRLILDGVDITNASGAAIAVLEADKTVVWLADGSENALADAAEYVLPDPEEDEPNATLFSKDDLTVAGPGALSIEANYNDGIASKDGLVIVDGTIGVVAADDGIRGKDYLSIAGGTLDVDAGGDALKSDEEDDAGLGYIQITGGTLDLTAGSDAIEGVSDVVIAGGDITIAADDDGIHSEAWVEITDGTIDITRSYEGIEGTQIAISGGTIDVVSEDDGLNVAGGDANATTDTGRRGGGPGGGGFAAVEGWFVDISGGTITIDADGDGFDSNGDAYISGGTLVVNGPTSNGNGAIDVNGELLVSGGTLLAAGSAGMAEVPSADSEQAVLAIQFGGVPAGTLLHIATTDGDPIATFETSKTMEVLVLSTPELVAGETYEVFLDGSVSGESLGGYYPDGGYTAGTSAGTLAAY